MDSRNTQTAYYQRSFSPFEVYDNGDDELTRQRLDTLLKINAETALEKSLYASEKEKVEATLMKNPLSVEKTYAYFGLLLGTFPPAAFWLAFILEKRGLFGSEDFWFLGVFAVINLITATVGYFSGKSIGKTIGKIENLSWIKMILLLPFVGILWGIISGGAGGAIVFGIGAIVGAFIGALVGSAALPVFTIFHRLLKKGDMIDRSQFLPIAFGITFSICALILGL